jgi:hypothetical protein
MACIAIVTVRKQRLEPGIYFAFRPDRTQNVPKHIMSIAWFVDIQTNGTYVSHALCSISLTAPCFVSERNRQGSGWKHTNIAAALARGANDWRSISSSFRLSSVGVEAVVEAATDGVAVLVVDARGRDFVSPVFQVI